MKQEKQLPQLIVMAALMLIGLACSLYLAELFIQVYGGGGRAINSFCAVSEGFNCVTVANSKWSVALRVPTAFWGVEFYLALLAYAFLSYFSLWPFRKWQSILFAANALSLPFCLFLEFACIAYIKSICILCVTVHTLNLASVLFLGIFHRKRFKEFVFEGPLEILRIFASKPIARYLIITTVIVGASQIAWMPFVLYSDAPVTTRWQGMLVSGFSIGPVDAPIKIDEFTDFQCPFCGKAHHVIMELLAEYPDKILLTHRDYPLDIQCNPYLKKPFHPDACNASLYARCAAQQDLFRPMEELLFGNRFMLQKSDMKKNAEQIGCDMDRFHQCLDDPETMRALLEDIHEAKRRGIKGTPTFYVNGEPNVGLKSLERWREIIQPLLVAH